MLIAEEFLLLSLDNESGKPMIGNDRLGPALGGALVAELALMERIGVTPHDAGWSKRGRITITNLTPTDDPELDEALRKLAESEGKKVKDVLSDFASKKVRLSYKLRERLLERLAKAGVLKQQEGTVLGFIPRTTWPAGDHAAEDEVRRAAAVGAGLWADADRADAGPDRPAAGDRSAAEGGDHRGQARAEGSGQATERGGLGGQGGQGRDRRGGGGHGRGGGRAGGGGNGGS